MFQDHNETKRWVPPFRLWTVVILCAGLWRLAEIRQGFAPRFAFGFMTAVAIYAGLVWLAGFGRMTVARRLSCDVLQAGQSLHVELEILRPAWIPIVWMSVADVLERKQGAGGEGIYVFRRLLFPMLRRQIRVRYSITGLPRGCHAFVRTEIATGDLFGLVTRKRTVVAQGTFRIVPEPMRGIPPLPPGEGEEETVREQAGIRNSVADVLVREYVPGDPYRLIHWKASARRGRLMTRMQEAAEERQWVILLDSQADHYAGARGRWLYELGVSLAAGLLLEASSRQAEAAFSDCRHDWLNWKRPSVPDGYGPELAECMPDGRTSFSAVVADFLANLPPGAALALITPELGEGLVSVLAEAQTAGHPVLVFHLEGGPGHLWRKRTGVRRAETAGCRVIPVTGWPSEREVAIHVSQSGA